MKTIKMEFLPEVSTYIAKRKLETKFELNYGWQESQAPT